MAIDDALPPSVSRSVPPMTSSVPDTFTPCTLSVPVVMLAKSVVRFRQSTSDETGARFWSQLPESVRFDVDPRLVQVMVQAPPWSTWMFVSEPVVPVVTPVAIRFCVPTVLNVARRVPVPVVSVASAGSVAAESLLVKCTLSANPVATLPKAS